MRKCFPVWPRKRTSDARGIAWAMAAGTSVETFPRLLLKNFSALALRTLDLT